MANTGKYAGSETEKNLYAAFAGETQARSKYTYFASVAKKQGFEQIAELFQRTADNEKEHAKLWFEELGGPGDTSERGGRRELRMDRYVRIVCGDGGKGRLSGSCGEVQTCRGGRKASRGALPQAPS